MEQRKGLGAADLIALGFEHAADWEAAGEDLAYRFLDGLSERMEARFSVSNALYAFCADESVFYIGKTGQSLRNRFKGYCKPGNTQSTNIKCHEAIKKALSDGRSINILVFTSPEDMLFRGYPVNLAAGLEDVLIRKFFPPWNGGRRGGAALTETSEYERSQLGLDSGSDRDRDTSSVLDQFTIRLHPTYYNQGIINPGAAVSDLFGEADAQLTIGFSDGMPAISTRIDRRANQNGSVRLVGGNQLVADWFQRNFELGEDVTARILSPYHIKLMAPE